MLLSRIMPGGVMPSLWGAAGFFEPAEECELLGELRRIASAHGLGEDRAGFEAALQLGARELVCFVPPSRHAERRLFTLEGDPAVAATASWHLRDPDAAFAALCKIPELAWDGETDDADSELFSWLTPRRALVARRPPLPPGAICLESGPVGVGQDGELQLEDATCLGTFKLRADQLEFFGLSKRRLEAAADLVARRLGSLAGRARRRVEPLPAGPPSACTRGGSRNGATDLPEGRLGELLYRRWLDDPQLELSGLSPRQAASHPEHRATLERLLRSIEHGSARERRDGKQGPEVGWVRSELGLDTPLAA